VVSTRLIADPRCQSQTVTLACVTALASRASDDADTRSHLVFPMCNLYLERYIGFMYGRVCETGGTREVLPPRPIKRVTFKDLL